ARGYFGPEAEASDAFDGDSFYSADRGSLSADGLLTLHGRESNVVNLGGPKTTLEAIEALYASVPGVREVASAVTPDHLGVDRLVAFVQPSEQWSEQAFWDHCHRTVAPDFWPSKLVVLQQLPKVATGKIDRQRLLSMV